MRAELATSGAIIAFCSVLLWQALQLPPPRFERLGSGFFPTMTLSVIIALCCLDVLLEWRKRRIAARTQKNADAAAPAKKQAARSFLSGTVVLQIATIVLFASYILLLQYTDISYFILTFLFILTVSWMMVGFSPRRIVPILLVGGGVVGFIYLIFGVCIYTFFP